MADKLPADSLGISPPVLRFGCELEVLLELSDQWVFKDQRLFALADDPPFHTLKSQFDSLQQQYIQSSKSAKSDDDPTLTQLLDEIQKANDAIKKRKEDLKDAKTVFSTWLTEAWARYRKAENVSLDILNEFVSGKVRDFTKWSITNDSTVQADENDVKYSKIREYPLTQTH